MSELDWSILEEARCRREFGGSLPNAVRPIDGTEPSAELYRVYDTRTALPLLLLRQTRFLWTRDPKTDEVQM